MPVKERAGVGAPCHGGDQRIVAVEHGQPAVARGGQCLHDLVLGEGDVLHRSELAQVRAPDLGDDADGRRGMQPMSDQPCDGDE